MRKECIIGVWKQGLLYFSSQLYSKWEAYRGYRTSLTSEPLSQIHSGCICRKTGSKINFISCRDVMYGLALLKAGIRTYLGWLYISCM